MKLQIFRVNGELWLWADSFPVMTAAQERLSKTAQAFARMDAARKEIAMRQEARRRAKCKATIEAVTLVTHA